MNQKNTDALIVTYKRPNEVERLLASLLDGSLTPRKITVVDNSPSSETEKVCTRFGSICRYIAMGENVGVGGGFNSGIRSLADDPPDFVCALDDDCVVSRDTLRALSKTLQSDRGVSFAAPIVTDKSGKPEACPGFIRAKDKVSFESASSWESLCTLKVTPLKWSTGICLMYRYKDAIQSGLYRDDCWVLGEDIEFTLRLSSRSPGRLISEKVTHLPPAPTNRLIENQKVAYVKFLALITNLSFFSTHLPHARREIFSIPKLVGRFLLTAIKFPGATKLHDAALAVWLGVARGHAAGTADFARAFRAKYIPQF